MKVFGAFLFLCFVGGIVLYRVDQKRRSWVLVGLCIAVAVLYFFFYKL